MKLALGTAQFGLPYGVANQRGQVSRRDASEILARARAGGVDTLDTAIGYGDSERRLGEIGVDGWKVISKLPEVPVDCGDLEAWTESEARGSLCRLRVRQLDALLLHRPAQLLDARGEALWHAVLRLKALGLARKVGISIYDPAELDPLVPRFRFDVIQAPFNVLDRRLAESGWLQRLGRAAVEVHARSVFLQGLLAMAAERRPASFSRWAPLFEAYDTWVARCGVSRAEACLRFVIAQPAFGRVVVGVDSLAHLEELLQSATGGELPVAPPCGSADPDLLNPSRWTALR